MNPDYLSLVHIEDSLYLVDRKSYYLLCTLQEFKPSIKELYSILDWLINNKMAIKLGYKQLHHLMFIPSKNCRDN
jgi:hypothetical protein